MNNDRRNFLENEVPELLSQLTAETPSKFGMMTPHHMVEHLIMVLKVSCKRYGDPPAEPSGSAMKFKEFVQGGAIFRHFPGKSTLEKLRTESLSAAIELYPSAVQRFYTHYLSNPGFKGYNPIQGELDFEEFELVHYNHVKYHLAQFGIGKYSTVT